MGPTKELVPVIVATAIVVLASLGLPGPASPLTKFTGALAKRQKARRASRTGDRRPRLSKDEARRIAVNFAKLLLRR